MAQRKQALSSFCILLLTTVLFSIGTTCFGASVPPKGYPTPIALREMNGGFWRSDHTFSPILYITNLLVTNSLQVTPVLYMADGTEYDLAPVTVSAAGVVRVSISDALRVAPAKIQPHISEFGSIGLRYQWHWQNAVSAMVQNLDTTRSLNFNYPLHTAMKMTNMPPATIHKQGLWWKEEPNVEASVNLVNVSMNAVSVRVEVLSSLNQLRDSQRLVVSPNSTAHVELALPEDQRAGGVRVSYHGMDGDVLVTGALEDAAVGYSAKIPFTSMVKEKVSDLAVSSVGLMMGQPDPMMGFPRGTKFGVYSAFRNTSNRTIAVTPTLYYMAGASNKVVPLQPLNLSPGEARYWSPQDFSQASGLGTFSGMANLVFSYHGTSGEIILANGSIDNTKTYVFESELNGVGKSQSKGLTAWNLADGNDTMISLLNTSSQDEDLFVTLYHSQGKYRMPVHLKAGASMMFNVSDLIMMRTPDLDGNLLPINAISGSAVVSGKDSDADWIEVAVGIGIFNVTTATCGTMCPTCYGYSNFLVQGNTTAVNIGGTATFSAYAFGQNGQWSLTSAVWSSSNSSVASSQGGGNFTGIKAGTFAAIADTNLIDENADCPEGQHTPCPTSPYESSAGGSIYDPTPNITGVSPGSWNAGTSTPIRVTGTGFGTNPTLSIIDPNHAVTGVSVSAVSNTEIDATVTIAGSAPAENATVTVTSNGYNGQGFVSNQGNGPTSPSASVPINPANVSISGPKGIVNGTSTGFSVSNPNSLSLTLTLSFSGNGRATFGTSGGTSTSLTSGGTVTVSGTAISSTANDVTITVKDQFGNALASTQFSVIWVTLQLNTSGPLQNDDDVRGVYFNNTSSQMLGLLSPALIGVEIQGQVQPTNFTDTVNLVRTKVSFAEYDDTNNGSTSVGSYSCSDSSYVTCTNDPTTAGSDLDNSPSSQGRIYNWDTPGAVFDTTPSPNEKSRARMNFAEWATYNGQTASTVLLWYNRASVKADASSVSSFDSSIAADNQAGTGMTATTWNLN